MRSAFHLVDDGVARVAILADNLAVLADMIAIMAAETSLEIEMPDVVGMSLPVHLHVGEKCSAIDALQFRNGAVDAVGFAGGDLRILLAGRTC